MLKLAFAAPLAALLIGAAAPDMTVAQFLAKAASLKSKGVLAVGSPDIAVLRDTAKAAATDYRASLAAEAKAGKPPSSCPPPVGKATVTGTDLLADFAAIPAAKRGVSVKTAFAAMMKKRYPCNR